MNLDNFFNNEDFYKYISDWLKPNIKDALTRYITEDYFYNNPYWKN